MEQANSVMTKRVDEFLLYQMKKEKQLHLKIDGLKSTLYAFSKAQW